MICYDKQFTRESKEHKMTPEEYLIFYAKKNNKMREEILYNLATRLQRKLKSNNDTLNLNDINCLISYYEDIIDKYENSKFYSSDFISKVYNDAAASYFTFMEKKIAKNGSVQSAYDEKIIQYYTKAIEFQHDNYAAIGNLTNYCFVKGDFVNARSFLACLLDKWDKAKSEESSLNYFKMIISRVFKALTRDEVAFGPPFVNNKNFVFLCNQDKIHFYEELLDFYKNSYFKFENVVSVNEEEFVLYNILGNLYIYAGEYQKAYSIYINFITIMPELYEPYIKLSLINLRYNTPESGKKVEEYALKGLELLEMTKEGLNKKAYMNAYYSLNIHLSGALNLQEKYDEAKSLIEKLLGKHRSICKMSKEQLNSCYHHLGTVYFKTNQYKPAAKYVQKAIDLYPDESSYELMGNIFDREEKKQLALRYYELAYKYARKYVDNKKYNFDLSSVMADEENGIKGILVKLIRTCQQVNDVKKAREYLKEAKKYYDKDADFIELEVELADTES